MKKFSYSTASSMHLQTHVAWASRPWTKIELRPSLRAPFTSHFTMKLLRLVLLPFALVHVSLRAANDPAAVWRAMDDARVQAMISADPATLATVFSDELRYVHSSGKLDTKVSFIKALASGASKYNSVTYEQRDFREVVPGLVLMDGRCRVTLGKTAPFTELHLSFLAAYRLEKGTWRFLAWQSCKLPDPATPAKP
jgi:hypothetical protein